MASPRPRRWLPWAAILSVATAFGCMTQPQARYIYQDGEYGVIGIPQNSPYGRQDYTQQAHALMTRHFPDGYEIVRAEEVVEGQRILDRSRQSQFETDPSFSALDQKINLGKVAQTMSTQTKDSLPILESRILYRRKSAGNLPGPNGYSIVSDVKPKLYLDPNDMAREQAALQIAELKNKEKPTAVASQDKSKDGDAKQAAATGGK